MELDQEEERCDDDQLVAEKSKQFWRNTWNQSAEHKEDAKWFQDLQSEVNVKNRRRQILPLEVLKRYFLECQIGSHQVQTLSRDSG